LPVATFGYSVHGPKELQWLQHPIEWGLTEGFHAVGGTGPFDGWPKYNSSTHQQMYHTWVKRAYEGGVRLMVMFAIKSEALCLSQKQRAGWDCDDMKAVDRQIQAAKDFEWAMDWLDDGLINGSGWYRIAYSPQQARQIIRDGKMAVVLGIEVDSLFNCKFGRPCLKEYREEQLRKYYNLGVRHLFPIHHYDNAEPEDLSLGL
jgi:microsomal dipeptidase-like Zn-dependent dipeptidase